MVGLGVDFADAPEYVSHNSLGTAVLLRAMHELRFEGRFVLASSMVVYGDDFRGRQVRAGVLGPPGRISRFRPRSGSEIVRP